MDKQPRAPRYGLWILAGLMLFTACGGDDDGASETDAGLYCNPLLGGPSSCYCPTGTLGLRRCNVSTEQWDVCMCNEPTPPFMCTEGQLLACMCPDGTSSQRLCRASNTVDACMCEGHMGMDSGIDAGDEDAS